MEPCAAPWKLVIGHHPIRSNHRETGDYQELVDNLEPLFIQYNVQAYFAGHDHNLGLMHHPGRKYYQVISGAGSKIGEGFDDDRDAPFQYDSNGFVAVEMTKEGMKVEFLGVESEKELFSYEIPLET